MPPKLSRLFLLLALTIPPAQQPIHAQVDPIDVRAANPVRTNIPHYAVDPYTQIRIRYIEGWSVTVWSFKDNARIGIVDGYDCKTDRIYLFTGPPGQYLAHAIGPNAEPYQELITIRSTPGPDPGPDPNPPDPNPPDPNPPVPPIDVPNVYEIGRAIYAVSLKLPATQVSEFANLIDSQLNLLSRQSITPDQLQATLRAKRQSYGAAWSSWETTAESTLTNASNKYGSSVAAFLRYYSEMSKAMSMAASRSSRSR